MPPISAQSRQQINIRTTAVTRESYPIKVNINTALALLAFPSWCTQGSMKSSLCGP